jgi:hypothetical protein
MGGALWPRWSARGDPVLALRPERGPAVARWSWPPDGLFAGGTRDADRARHRAGQPIYLFADASSPGASTMGSLTSTCRERRARRHLPEHRASSRWGAPKPGFTAARRIELRRVNSASPTVTKVVAIHAVTPAETFAVLNREPTGSSERSGSQVHRPAARLSGERPAAGVERDPPPGRQMPGQPLVLADGKAGRIGGRDHKAHLGPAWTAGSRSCAPSREPARA